MASAIDATKPTDTVGYAGDLRANLAAAKAEIEALQALVAQKIASLSADPNPTLANDLNLNGKKITTLVSNGSITIEPNGTGALTLTPNAINVARQIRHIGDTDTWIIFADTGNDIAFGTGDVARLSITDLGVRFGSGSRVTAILNEGSMASNSATALATQQSIKAYVDANKGIPSVSADTNPILGAPLNGGGFSIVNWTQPKISNVSGTLTQAAHGGRPCHITGNVSVPNTDGFVCELRNKSGSAKTVSRITGNLIHEGATTISISLPNNRSVVVAGDGADVWVYGALA